jgi:hypothetical protein
MNYRWQRIFTRWNYDGGSRSPAGYLKAVYTRPGFLPRAAAALVLLAASVLGSHNLTLGIVIWVGVVVGILLLGYLIWLWGTRQ